jgi:hypothetical protein
LQETRVKLEAQGFEPYFNGPGKTAEILKADIVKYGKIIKEGGIKAE